MGPKVFLFLLCVSLGAITPGVIGSAQEQGLKPGDMAPDFSLPGSDGRTYRLADFKGQRPVVLAWFPRTITKL